MCQKRESEDVRFARLAYRVAQRRVPPRYTHPKSPRRFTQPQWVVCLLLTQYLNLNYRNTEAWLLASAEVRDVSELSQVPDHTAISCLHCRRRASTKNAPRVGGRSLLHSLDSNQEPIG